MLASIKTSTRVAITIGCIFIGVVWVATGLRIVPDPKQNVVPARVRLCESLAISTSMLAEKNGLKEVEQLLRDSVSRNPEIVSMGLRDQSGQLLLAIGKHDTWSLPTGNSSTADQMSVTISTNGKPWVDLELQFQPIKTYGSWADNKFPIPIFVFCGCAGILLVWLYLSRILKHLNPSKVVPSRVRSAFDSLAEGLILTDEKCRIVLANGAFNRIVADGVTDLQGRNPDSFGWNYAEGKEEPLLPWVASFEKGQEHRGSILTYVAKDGGVRKFIVNSTPVFGEKEKCRGVLTSFDDVTELERKQDELVQTLQILQTSRDEIKRQNKELKILASVDPLSGCLNRRSFFEKFQSLWNRGDLLSTIMVDIDFFKLINDKHGHAVGDSFIRATGELLKNVVGSQGLVCRYGGEEFCVLLMQRDYDQAVRVGWSINRKISQTLVENLPFTASVGVSSRPLGAENIEQLLDEADKCLYIAKRRGRNTVVGWGHVTPEELQENSADKKKSEKTTEQTVAPLMPTSTINSLIAALAFRDRGTAEHSRRVANTCVAVGQDLLSSEELLDLETAGLLHDIGKIGVPDAILLKAGPLTDDEWKIMQRHDEMSYDIAKAASASERVAEVIKAHHERYKSKDNDRMPSIAARIVSVCDAFDAMTNDRVYRKGMSFEAAFAELRRCAPGQFDPEVVEVLIDKVTNDPGCIHFKTLDEIVPMSDEQLESHVLRLRQAISRADVDQFPTLIHQLKTVALASDSNPSLQVAADRLQEALERNETELDRLLELTQELLELSRGEPAILSAK